MKRTRLIHAGCFVLIGALLPVAGCFQRYDDFVRTKDVVLADNDQPADGGHTDKGQLADEAYTDKRNGEIGMEVVHPDAPSTDLCNWEHVASTDTEIADILDDNWVPVSCDNPQSYLCLPCEGHEDCGCSGVLCVEIGSGTFCTATCEEGGTLCPSGFLCQKGVCTPVGGKCQGCIQPPGCKSLSDTCNFKTGKCMTKVPWCEFCSFDFECGFGSRCYVDVDDNIYCAPECHPDNYSCPLSSGCLILDNGGLICAPAGKECCYGPGCSETCSCEEPTPVCDQEGQCVQRLVDAQCPPGKPTCDMETHTCVIQCLPPTAVYWVDPETNLEYCVQCAKSKDCPAGYLCGTFEGDPETYHKCYAVS